MVTPKSPISLRAVVFDCPEPAALASFYADLLNAQLDVSDPEWCEVFIGQPVPGCTLAFQRATPYTPPEWPDGTPQQLHLDLGVADLPAAGQRAVELGAVYLKGPVEEDGSTWVVYADPAGHPFCLCQDDTPPT
jgi:predicted enzyme related to lactoylglutathione lyase